MTIDSTRRDIFRITGFKKCGKSEENYAKYEGANHTAEEKTRRRGKDENRRNVTQMERQSVVETAPSANQQKAFLSTTSEYI